MSDFILPDDIYAMTQQASQNIADAWAMLTRICVVKQHPFEIAENQVARYINIVGLSEIEALRKVYHEVAKA